MKHCVVPRPSVAVPAKTAGLESGARLGCLSPQGRGGKSGHALGCQRRGFSGREQSYSCLAAGNTRHTARCPCLGLPLDNSSFQTPDLETNVRLQREVSRSRSQACANEQAMKRPSGLLLLRPCPLSMWGHKGRSCSRYTWRGAPPWAAAANPIIVSGWPRRQGQGTGRRWACCPHRQPRRRRTGLLFPVGHQEASRVASPLRL